MIANTELGFGMSERSGWGLAGLWHTWVLGLVYTEVWAKAVALRLLLGDPCRQNKRTCPQLWEGRWCSLD